MNKVVTINLNGNAYQLEEGAYDRLRDYLEGAARQLTGNPDRDEIIADIEQSIADKCRAALGSYRTVVSLPMIETILTEMGPVQDGSASAAPGGADAGKAGAAGVAAAEAKPAAEAAGAEPYRRLYRVREGAMVGGVCNGLAAYFGIDPTLVRLLFVLLALVTLGAAAAIYIVMMIVVPPARTPAENAAAFGSPSTAAEFIRRAREGYYEGMRTMQDKEAHRAWKRRFKDEMREARRHLRTELRAGRWRWQQNWAYGPGVPPPGAFFLWPLFGLIRAVLTVAFIACVLSLVFTGALFGMILPWGMPFWAGIVVLALLFNLIVWPFRLHRWGGCHDGPHGIFWIAMLVLGIWLADKYVPHFHEALQEIPPVLHRMGEDLRAWWARH
jgi:phage shock protein PspC (stress-responsive transcriptional regulator)